MGVANQCSIYEISFNVFYDFISILNCFSSVLLFNRTGKQPPQPPAGSDHPPEA